MADLIEVAELDSGKRELKLERIRPLQAFPMRATAIATRPRASASAWS